MAQYPTILYFFSCCDLGAIRPCDILLFFILFYFKLSIWLLDGPFSAGFSYIFIFYSVYFCIVLLFILAILFYLFLSYSFFSFSSSFFLLFFLPILSTFVLFSFYSFNHLFISLLWGPDCPSVNAAKNNIIFYASMRVRDFYKSSFYLFTFLFIHV